MPGKLFLTIYRKELKTEFLIRAHPRYSAAEVCFRILGWSKHAKAVASSPRPRFLSAAIEGAPGGRRSASPRLQALYPSHPNRQPKTMQENR
jgi:hypothetical protein